MTRSFHVKEECFNANCANEARSTDKDGDRLCGLCGDGILALRDVDVPELLVRLDSLLNVLDNQCVSAGIFERQDLRNMISRGSK